MSTAPAGSLLSILAHVLDFLSGSINHLGSHKYALQPWTRWAPTALGKSPNAMKQSIRMASLGSETSISCATKCNMTLEESLPPPQCSHYPNCEPSRHLPRNCFHGEVCDGIKAGKATGDSVTEGLSWGYTRFLLPFASLFSLSLLTP